MGRAGRPRKSPELHVLEGTAPAGKRVDAPKPRPIAPAIPISLTAAARRVWRKHANEMERVGLLSALDGQVFGTFCQAAADAKDFEELLAKDGRSYTTATGFIRARPEAALLREARRLMLACATELGLTPAARRRMSVLVDGGPSSGLEDLLD